MTGRFGKDVTSENFAPSPHVLSLLPEKRGNDINGLGETDVRRPSPIMWHKSEMLNHGDLQEWFWHNGLATGASAFRLENEFTDKPLPQVASNPPDWSIDEWTANVKKAALEREADIVGIARVNQDWVFEGYEAPYEWIIVLGVGMDYDCLKTAPSEKSQTECQRQYARGTRAAYKLASWMHEHGWEGSPHGGPEAGPVTMIPAAIEAGLGELGKHGSMITRKFGSSFRLACVLTNLPLKTDGPDIFGADDFCINCQICSNVCPVDAIYPEKQSVRGKQKWYVDFDECILYFVENNGCGVCIGQCPYSRPGIAPRLIEKMGNRRANLAAE